MKAPRDSTLFRFLINGIILLVLLLSSIMGFLLFRYGTPVPETQILLRLSLACLLLLITLLAVVHIAFRQLRKQAADDQGTDNLTGFLYRQIFNQVLEQALLEARRTLEPLSLVIIDIDRFRLINEEHGHVRGDLLLTLLSRSIQSVLRASDTTCRWGGNQFLVILKDCPEKDACRLAANILEKIRQQRRPLNGKSIKVTASIGVAQMLSTDSSQTLLARVETGLYSARDKGCDTYAIGYDWILIDYSCEPIFSF
ncbi:MAG: GGDEF domain-containing protein [Proteobacteria bacterium]|nr:GGDEF domain-containing protein [Pseudomonadota bacterium]MBU1059381.1 GGDEF domain-containing protein [Pseudomonadota bacterium]